MSQMAEKRFLRFRILKIYSRRRIRSKKGGGIDEQLGKINKRVCVYRMNGRKKECKEAHQEEGKKFFFISSFHATITLYRHIIITLIVGR